MTTSWCGWLSQRLSKIFLMKIQTSERKMIKSRGRSYSSNLTKLVKHLDKLENIQQGKKYLGWGLGYGGPCLPRLSIRTLCL